MTKKELKQKMLEFINRQEGAQKQEWWCTDRLAYFGVMKEFAEEVGIEITEGEML